MPNTVCFMPEVDVAIVHERLQLGHFVARFSGRWLRILKIPSDGTLRATKLSRNIDNVRTLLTHLLYHVKVLSAQHVGVLFWCENLKETTCRVERTIQMANYSLISLALTPGFYLSQPVHRPTSIYKPRSNNTGLPPDEYTTAPSRFTCVS